VRYDSWNQLIYHTTPDIHDIVSDPKYIV
jgi:hypothetical protein